MSGVSVQEGLVEAKEAIEAIGLTIEFARIEVSNGVSSIHVNGSRDTPIALMREIQDVLQCCKEFCGKNEDDDLAERVFDTLKKVSNWLL